MMSYVIKSLFVLIFLITVVNACIWLAVTCVKNFEKRCLEWKHVAITLFSMFFAVFCLLCFGDYVYPFERTLEPVLIAEIDAPKGYELEHPGQKFWHGAYEAYGLHAESLYYNPNNRHNPNDRDPYGIWMIPMDFQRYSYIITYGQKIESLSYNVWETIDVPVRTGAKEGHMVLSEEFHPEKVYIYQIPKMRIDNGHPKEDVSIITETVPKR